MYVGISEFAKMANVSRQAVYLRLDNEDFKKYVKIDNTNGKVRKIIDTEALILYGKNVNVDTKTCKADNEMCQNDVQIDCKADKPYKDIDKKNSEICKDENFYKEQLDRKDKLISDLMAQISGLQAQNKELSGSLIEQGKQLTRLLDQQQQLHQTQQMLLLKSSQKEKKEVQPEKPKQETQARPNRPTYKQEPQKKGFFSWLKK